jgi:hypothetical protein
MISGFHDKVNGIPEKNIITIVRGNRFRKPLERFFDNNRYIADIEFCLNLGLTRNNLTTLDLVK